MALLHNYTKEELAEMAAAFEADKKAFLEGSYTAVYNNVRSDIIRGFLAQKEREVDFDVTIEYFMLEFFKDEEKPYMENRQFYGYDVKATRLCQYFTKTAMATNDRHFKELNGVKAIVENAHYLINRSIELAFYRFNYELKQQKEILKYAKENKEELIERERKRIFKATGGKPEMFDETPEEAYINNWLTPLEENIATVSSGNAGSVQLDFLLPCPQNTILIDRYRNYDGNPVETEPQGYFINLQDMRKLLKEHIIFRHFKALEACDPEKAGRLEDYLNNVLRRSSMIRHDTYRTQASLTGITHLPDNLYNPTTTGTKNAFKFINPKDPEGKDPDKAFLAIKKPEITPEIMHPNKNGLYEFRAGFNGIKPYFLSYEALQEFTHDYDPIYPHIVYTALAEKFGDLLPEQIDKIPYTVKISYKELINKYNLNPRKWTPAFIKFEIDRTWGQAVGIVYRGYSQPDIFTFIHADYDGKEDSFTFTTPFIKALIRQQKIIRIDEARDRLPASQKKAPVSKLSLLPIASRNIKGTAIKAKDKIAIAMLYKLDQTIAALGEHISAFKLLKETPEAYYEYQQEKNKSRFLQRHFTALINYIKDYTVYYEKFEGFTFSAYENDNKEHTITFFDPSKELEEQPGLTPTQRNLKKLVYEFDHTGIEEAKEKKKNAKRKKNG